MAPGKAAKGNERAKVLDRNPQNGWDQHTGEVTSPPARHGPQRAPKPDEKGLEDDQQPPGDPAEKALPEKKRPEERETEYGTETEPPKWGRHPHEYE